MQTIGVSPKANRGTERSSRERVAVIGAGISGLAAAYRLSSSAEVTLYEARPRLGGHANTIDLEWEGCRYRVETGFVVFNRETYPLFDRLLHELEVASQPSDMSFSVRSERDGLEYCGTNLNTVFAQRKNLLRPRFWEMLKEIARFNRVATADLRRSSLPT